MEKEGLRLMENTVFENADWFEGEAGSACTYFGA